MEKREQVFKIITIILLVFVLFMVVFFLNGEDKDKKRQQAEAWAAVEQQAGVYQEELQELQKSLSALKSDTVYVSDRAELMIGFIVSDADDVRYMEEKADKYGFAPVIVVDCTDDFENITAYMEASNANRGGYSLRPQIFRGSKRNGFFCKNSLADAWYL